jgi:hypothetical protein
MVEGLGVPQSCPARQKTEDNGGHSRIGPKRKMADRGG